MEMAEVRGAESTNLYTGFMALCIPLLKQGGDLIAITPRSYCNGLYFTPFRRELISSVSLKRFYLFGSREEAFSDDEVLQENVILHAIKGAADHSEVVITQSDTVDDDFVLERRVPYNKVVYPGDSNYFFHLVPDDLSQQVADRMKSLPCSLADLRLSVSTGRAVDFRAKQYLLKEPTSGAIPLIYPTHFENGRISWPKCDGKKANALLDAPYTQDLAVPNDTYVLVKRFSSKEEKKRIVAVVYDPASITTDVVAFENHLNYFHRNGRGLPPRLAQGLAAFLNSSVVDTHFRLFNGHTQVNATDIRTLRFPPEHVLLSIGTRIGSAQLTQGEIDEIIEIYIMDEDQGQMRNPRIINSRIEEEVFSESV